MSIESPVLFNTTRTGLLPANLTLTLRDYDTGLVINPLPSWDLIEHDNGSYKLIIETDGRYYYHASINGTNPVEYCDGYIAPTVDEDVWRRDPDLVDIGGWVPSILAPEAVTITSSTVNFTPVFELYAESMATHARILLGAYDAENAVWVPEPTWIDPIPPRHLLVVSITGSWPHRGGMDPDFRIAYGSILYLQSPDSTAYETVDNHASGHPSFQEYFTLPGMNFDLGNLSEYYLRRDGLTVPTHGNAHRDRRAELAAAAVSPLIGPAVWDEDITIHTNVSSAGRMVQTDLPYKVWFDPTLYNGINPALAMLNLKRPDGLISVEGWDGTLADPLLIESSVPLEDKCLIDIKCLPQASYPTPENSFVLYQYSNSVWSKNNADWTAELTDAQTLFVSISNISENLPEFTLTITPHSLAYNDGTPVVIRFPSIEQGSGFHAIFDTEGYPYNYISGLAYVQKDSFNPVELLDTPLEGHTTAGSVGAALSVTDPWATDLPGSYSGADAGYVMVQMQQAFQQFAVTLSQLMSKSYQSGVVSLPTSAASGDTLVLFEDTDYDDVQFPLNVGWVPYLQDAETKVWFTAVSNARVTTPEIDVEGYVYDAAKGICRVNITADDIDVKPGEYFWQLQLRKTVSDGGDPPVVTTQKRIALEGKLLIKPQFKR